MCATTVAPALNSSSAGLARVRSWVSTLRSVEMLHLPLRLLARLPFLPVLHLPVFCFIFAMSADQRVDRTSSVFGTDCIDCGERNAATAPSPPKNAPRIPPLPPPPPSPTLPPALPPLSPGGAAQLLHQTVVSLEASGSLEDYDADKLSNIGSRLADEAGVPHEWVAVSARAGSVLIDAVITSYR